MWYFPIRDGVARMNIADVIAYHESKNADITMVTRSVTAKNRVNGMLLKANADGRVTEVRINPVISEPECADNYVNVAVSIASFNQSYRRRNLARFDKFRKRRDCKADSCVEDLSLRFQRILCRNRFAYELL